MSFQHCPRHAPCALILILIFSWPCAAQNDFLEHHLELLRASKTRESIEECTKRIKANEKDALAYAVRSLAFAQEFRPQEAAADSRKSTSLASNDLHVACCRASVLMHFGKIPDAMKILEQVEAKIADDGFALMVKATAYLQADDPWAAGPVIERALKQESENPGILAVKADYFASLGKFKEAGTQLTQALALEPGALRLRAWLASIRSTDEWGAAIQELDKLATQFPDKALIYYFRSNAYSQFPLSGEATRTLNGRKISREQAMEAAFRDAKVCAALNPRDPELLVPMLEIYLTRNELNKALQIANQALDRWALDGTYWDHRARVHDMMSNSEAAQADYQRARERNPDSYRSYLEEGYIKLQYFGNSMEAEKLFDKVIEMHPKKLAEAYSLRGDSRVMQRQFDKAADDFSIAQKLEPMKADTYVQWGDFWYQQEAWEKAEKALTRAIELDPKFSEAFRCRGSTRLSKMDWAAAESDHGKALELDPANFSAWMEKGIALTMQDRANEAELDFAKALELYPDRSSFYLERAGWWVQFGNWAAAANDLSQLIEEDPTNAELRVERGVVLAMQKKPKEAEKDFSKAKELSKQGDFWLANNRAYYWIAFGNWEEAEKDLTQILAQEAKSIAALNQRADVYLQLKKWELAEKDLTQLIQLRPQDAAIYKARGDFYQKQNRLEEAEQDWTKAIELNPDDAGLLFVRGKMRAAQKRWEEAVMDFSEVIGINPETEGVFRARADALQKLAAQDAEKIKESKEPDPKKDQ